MHDEITTDDAVGRARTGSCASSCATRATSSGSRSRSRRRRPASRSSRSATRSRSSRTPAAPLEVDARHHISKFRGSHGLGHVRLATESITAVAYGHPFWAEPFPDVSIVHNGQITNYYTLRRQLIGRGFRFQTGNDSELIAVYLADKMSRGPDVLRGAQGLRLRARRLLRLPALDARGDRLREGHVRDQVDRRRERRRRHRDGHRGAGDPRRLHRRSSTTPSTPTRAPCSSGSGPGRVLQEIV